MSYYEDDDDSFYHVEHRDSSYSRDQDNSATLLTFEALEMHNASRPKKAESQVDAMLSCKNSSNLDEVLQFKDPKQFQETQFQRENGGGTLVSQSRRPSAVNSQRSPLPQLSLSNSQKQSLQIQQGTRPRTSSHELYLDDNIRRSMDDPYSGENYSASNRRRSYTSDSRGGGGLPNIVQRRGSETSSSRANSGPIPIPVRRASETFDSVDPMLEEALRRSLISERVDGQARSQQSEFLMTHMAQTQGVNSRRSSVDSGSQQFVGMNSGLSIDTNPTSPRAGQNVSNVTPTHRCTPGSSPHISSPISDGSVTAHVPLTSQQIIAARVRAYNLIAKSGNSPSPSSPSMVMFASATSPLPPRAPSPTGSTSSRPAYQREGSDPIRTLSRESSSAPVPIPHSPHSITSPLRQVDRKQLWPEITPDYSADLAPIPESSCADFRDLRIHVPTSDAYQDQNGGYEQQQQPPARRSSYQSQQPLEASRRPSYVHPPQDASPRDDTRRPSYVNQQQQRRPSVQYQEPQYYAEYEYDQPQQQQQRRPSVHYQEPQYYAEYEHEQPQHQRDRRPSECFERSPRHYDDQSQQAYSPQPPQHARRESFSHSQHGQFSSPSQSGQYQEERPSVPLKQSPHHYSVGSESKRDYSDGHTSIDRQSFDPRAVFTRSRTNSESYSQHQLQNRPLSMSAADHDNQRSFGSFPRHGLSDEHMGGGGGGGTSGMTSQSGSPAHRLQTQKLSGSWQCAICTLVNVATYLVCEACGTTKNPMLE